jgi:hypothetical protein
VIFPNQHACEEILAILAKFDLGERDLILAVVGANRSCSFADRDPWHDAIAAFIAEKPDPDQFFTMHQFCARLGLNRAESELRSTRYRIAKITRDCGLVSRRMPYGTEVVYARSSAMEAAAK